MLAGRALRVACRMYPFVRGRGAIANLTAPTVEISPGTVRRLGNRGPEIELLPGQFGSTVTWLFGIDEPREMAWFRRLVPPGGVVIDVGANIGQYTLIAAQIAGPSGRVFSFEPDPVNAETLERSIRRNGFGDRVEVLRVAAAAKTGEAAFVLRPDRTRSGLCARGPEDGGPTEAIQVRTMALDDFLEERALDRLDFLKVDVEGADLDALRGVERTIRRFQPALMVEYEPEWLRAYGERPESLLDFIEGLGYTYRFVNARGVFPRAPTMPGARGGNLICTRIGSRSAQPAARG